MKQTGHVGFSADAKVLKIFHQTVMIDSKNCGMTLQAVTNLAEDASKNMKLVGVRGVGSPHVRRNEKQHRERAPRDARHQSRLCAAAGS